MTSIRREAPAAIEQFLATFAKGGTRGQRRTYMREYVAYLSAALGRAETRLTVGDLLDRRNVDDWLAAASRGATRRRRGAEGHDARAAPNSMAARVTTLNTFSRFCGSPLRVPRPRAEPPPPHLTSVEAHRALRLLAAHRPNGMTAGVWERTVALVSLAVCSRRGLRDLHAMRRSDVELDRPLPRVRVAGEWYPLDVLSAGLLKQWLVRRESLTAAHGLHHGGGSLWVATRRSSAGPRKSTVAPWPSARIRTLEAAHRNLTTRVLGCALRMEQFCGADRPPLVQGTPTGPALAPPRGRLARGGARLVGPGPWRRTPGGSEYGPGGTVSGRAGTVPVADQVRRAAAVDVPKRPTSYRMFRAPAEAGGAEPASRRREDRHPPVRKLRICRLSRAGCAAPCGNRPSAPAGCRGRRGRGGYSARTRFRISSGAAALVYARRLPGCFFSRSRSTMSMICRRSALGVPMSLSESSI